MQERTLQGALTFLGFVISLLAVGYFATTYLPRVSEWTRLGALILLGASLAFVGVYLRSTTVGEPFFGGPRLAWLRPPVVLYLAALFCGIVAEIVFLGIGTIEDPVKVLVSLVVGIGMIILVAQSAKRTRKPAPPPS